jgi:hypothetical protein
MSFKRESCQASGASYFFLRQQHKFPQKKLKALDENS